MKRLFESFLVIFFVFNIISAVMYHKTSLSIYFSLCITFGTMFYHFLFRWIVGKIVKQDFNCNNSWFREKRYEKALYKLLKVKKWKRFAPSYNGKTDFDKNDINDYINTTCRNEIIHEINMLLSFVPILFGIYAGAYIVFVVTSVFACLFDSIFVIVQRYNRPRLIKISKRYKS